jgi:phage terminase large subunit
MHVELPFAPRPWQEPLLEDPAARIVAVVHRRAGKSAALMWRLLKRGLTHQRAHIPKHMRRLHTDPVRVIHTLPQQVSWSRTGLWDRLERAAKAIPGARVQRADMRVLLPNGSVYQAGGIDKPDSWRGGYADEIVLDEYDDTTAEGLLTSIEPMLADFEGVLVRSGTPKGLGKLKRAYDEAADKPGHSRYLLTWRETGALSEAALDRMREEMSEEEFAQELECSFETPNSGAYYAKAMQEAERTGRVGIVPYDPMRQVTCAWDLGTSDDTAIWFCQQVGTSVRVIDYLENSGQGLEHYVAMLERERSSAKSFEASMREMRIGRVTVLPPADVDTGIKEVRLLLPRCVFASKPTEVGRKALWHYRRAWDERNGVFRPGPVHDWSSHAADAFRYLAMGLRAEAPEDRDARVRNLPTSAGRYNPYDLGRR